MKGQRSNYIVVQGIRGRARMTCCWEWIFQQWENSDILNIRKGGDIVYMTPYTQTQIWKMRQEWLEWRPTSLFILILPNFLRYHIHLPWRLDIDINLADYGRKEINIPDIWDAWLLPYFWISPHYHPYGSVDWDSQGPQLWPSLMLLNFFLYPGAYCGCHYAR